MPPSRRQEFPRADDDVDATQVTTDEGRWRAGVNRQAQPEAAEHQIAAAKALAVQRKADAMTAEERKARNARSKRQKRAAEKAKLELSSAIAQAGRDFAHAIEESGQLPLEDGEEAAFVAWCEEEGYEFDGDWAEAAERVGEWQRRRTRGRGRRGTRGRPGQRTTASATSSRRSRRSRSHRSSRLF